MHDTIMKKQKGCLLMFLHKIDDELALKLVEPQDAEAIFI
ncbi:hypothetical protein NBRC111894_4547 [Sporolactobacillus inulinus]|uniref:Uncharacterized protein n=1 Tax=Sporolactobacillus inulinus TaxID=2078 RepID=A0A4Y1ZJ88_9BACL|nr:hypothetical protein NBRC111894_4547 [Sporolactobacillus inulinus]